MTEIVVTQVGVEVADTGAPNAEVSVAAGVAVNTGAPDAKVSTAVAEAVNIGDPDARVSGAWVNAINIGAPAAEVSVVALEVWRTIRDAPYPIFPVRLFQPPTLGVRLTGGGIYGPPSISGHQDVEAMTAGGRWTFDFGQMPVLGPEQVKTWRMFVAAADWGARPCLVTLWDRRHQPVNARFTGLSPLGTEVWADPTDGDTIGFDEVDATFSENNAAHATTIHFTYTGPKAVGAGDHFSVYGRRYNWRLYRIIRVLSDVDGEVTAIIRPPLREQALVGERLSFDFPLCVARVDGDRDVAMDDLRNGQGQMALVECDSRYP